MKKILSVLLAAVMALSLAACGGNQNSSSSSSNEASTKAAETKAESNTASSAANTGSRVLVLYFSAANTKDVDAVTTATPMVNGTSSVKWMADIIHNEVGGDIEPIIPSKDYPLEYDALADAAKAEVDNNERPAFEALEVNPADYDTIFIGYPVWWYTIPMVVETFFDKYDLSARRLFHSTPTQAAVTAEHTKPFRSVSQTLRSWKAWQSQAPTRGRTAQKHPSPSG